MSTKEIVVGMLDALTEEQLDGLMVMIRSFITPNAETIAAIKESEMLLNNPDTRKFHSVDELFEELES